MGRLLGSSTNVTSFSISGDMPSLAEVWNELSSALSKTAFYPIDGTNDEASLGWVTFDDPAAIDFSDQDSVLRDRYLALTFRCDTRRLPGAVFREAVEKQKKAYLEKHPELKRIPKAVREEIREQVRTRLLSKTLPVPNICDLVYDFETHDLLIGTGSPAQADVIVGLFKKTFPGIQVSLIHAFARAYRLVDTELKAALERASTIPPSGSALDHVKHNAWLGSDFLTWLAFQTASGAGEYTVEVSGPMAPSTKFVGYVNSKMNLAGDTEYGRSRVLLNGPQESFRELKTAILSQKKITDAMLYFEVEELQWRLTLNAGSFTVSGLRCPRIVTDTDAEDEKAERLAVFFEKMHGISSALQMLDSLYLTFLRLRLSPKWGAELTDLQQWLES